MFFEHCVLDGQELSDDAVTLVERVYVVKVHLILCFSPETNFDLPEEEKHTIMYQEIHKMVEMPAVPRIGEELDLGSNNCGVRMVEHDIKNQMINVHCDVALDLAVEYFLAAREGWNLDDLSYAGKELFLKKVKQYEAKMAQE